MTAGVKHGAIAEAPAEEGTLARLALRAARVGTWAWDPQTGAMFWSDELHGLLGAAPGTHPPSFEGLLRAVHPEDRARVEEELRAAAAAGRAIDIEVRVRGPDGAERWLDFKGETLGSPDGPPLRMTGAAVEVTGRKRAEMALREREQQLKLALDTARLGEWQLDLATFAMACSARCKADFGLPPDARFSYEALLAAIHPDDREPMQQAVRRALDERGAYEAEYRAVWPDGSVHWIVASGRVVVVEDRPVRMVGVTLDVTERRRWEAAQRESEERFRHLADNAPVMVWVTDAGGQCTFLSESWYRYTGQTPETGLGLGWTEAVHPDDRAAAVAGFLAANEKAEPFSVDYRFRRRDGAYRWAIDSGVPRVGPQGEHLGYVGSVMDIHERKEIEAALSLQAELLAQTHDAVVVWEVGGGITYWNHGAEVLYGLTRAEAIGRSIHELVHTVHPRPTAGIERTLERDGSWEGELVHTTPDGRRITIESRQVLRRQDGRTHVMEINRDVTERRRAEEELRRSEAHLRLVADHAPVLIAHVDLERRFKYVNAAYAARFGLRPADVVGKTVVEIVGSRAYEAIRPYMDATLAGEPATFELHVPYERIEQRVMFCAYEPVRDSAGQVRGMIAVVIDMTERRRADEAVRAIEARFRELADSMPQIVFTARPDGFTDYFNRRWYELTGTPEGDTRDEVWTQTLHPDDRQRCLDVWYEAVRTGEPYQIEYRFKFPAMGEYRWHLARALPARDAAGHITCWYGTCTDIHDHKLAQDALKETDRRKDEFLAMLAHELRNPLAPIRNAVRVLQRVGSSEAKLQQMHDVIDRQSEHLTRLVDDLLDVSRITQGKVTLRTEKLDLSTVVGRAVEMSRPLVDARRHQLTVTLPPEPLRLEGDLARLAQVIANLLNNAAKYTPQGGHIQLEAERRDGEVLVRVKDDGQGIPPALLPRVFDLFMQVDRALDRNEGGLGIGLTLVRKLAEMHGGRVEAFSAGPGRGSEFVLHLPALAEAPPVSAAAPGLAGDRPSSPGCRILVVDDNLDSAESMATLLQIEGHEVQVAHDGQSAVTSALTFQPHVMLLDIGLPGLDGYGVARALRARPEMQKAVLIALTGYGMEEDRRRSREAGFDHHLTKPVDFDLLSPLIGSLVPA